MTIKLVIQRELTYRDTTLGKLYIDRGNCLEYVCETLEDAVREKKIYGKTAIPAGRYNVVNSFSNRFKRTLPEVQNVPGFLGVRMHGGNTDEDTHGCPLLGMRRDSATRISNCAPAVATVKSLINEHGGAILEIRPYKPPLKKPATKP